EYGINLSLNFPQHSLHIVHRCWNLVFHRHGTRRSIAAVAAAAAGQMSVFAKHSPELIAPEASSAARAQPAQQAAAVAVAEALPRQLFAHAALAVLLRPVPVPVQAHPCIKKPVS